MKEKNLNDKVTLYVEKDSKNLDLVWEIYERIENCDVTKPQTCGEMCVVCKGDGDLPCRFCRGTGFLMLADELIGTENDCPVCKGSGIEECKKCKGAGIIAFWQES